MTPAELGYVKCMRCRCLRPESQLEAKGFGAKTEGLGCMDLMVCRQLAADQWFRICAEGGWAFDTTIDHALRLAAHFDPESLFFGGTP